MTQMNAEKKEMNGVRQSVTLLSTRGEKKMRYWPLMAFVLLLLTAISAAQQSPPTDPHKVPVISANLGDCSVEILVTDSASKPVYGATISVHMRYGFGGFHKMDLEIGTNVDGRARFEGLSDRARMPLEFTVRYQQRETTVPVDLKKKCHASETAVLPDKPPPAETNPGASYLLSGGDTFIGADVWSCTITQFAPRFSQIAVQRKSPSPLEPSFITS